MIRSARLHFGKNHFPFSGRIRLCLFSKLIEGYTDALTLVGPTPEDNILVSLKHHVAGENSREPYFRFKCCDEPQVSTKQKEGGTHDLFHRIDELLSVLDFIYSSLEAELFAENLYTVFS